MYSGTNENKVNNGNPKRYISLGIARESIKPEKADKKTCKIISIILKLYILNSIMKS